MKILVVIEHDHQDYSPANLAVISAAQQIGGEISVLVAGKNCDAVIEKVSLISGINDVIAVKADCYEHALAETLAPLIVEHAQGFSHILGPATTFGKNVMPRVAGLLNIGQISDVVAVVNESTFIRPIYAGNALAKVKSLDAQRVITVRPTAFEPAPLGENAASVREVQSDHSNAISQFIDYQQSCGDRPQLTSAEIVISGGRGLKDKANFQHLIAIADKLGAAIGASRAAVDAGLVPNDWQVGQTGAIVAPKLYVAIGISGAIQHLAGMKDSKVIVAINKDPDAPIFQVADYGLVADLFEILPQWEALLGVTSEDVRL